MLKSKMWSSIAGIEIRKKSTLPLSRQAFKLGTSQAYMHDACHPEST
jgi:hypothetical protein